VSSLKEYWKLAGATVFDPIHHDRPMAKDLWICDGKIAQQPSPSDTDISVQSFDLSGLVVMPGGVDMHCHIAGGKVNAARLLRLDQKDYSPGWWAEEHDQDAIQDNSANPIQAAPSTQQAIRQFSHPAFPSAGGIPTTLETGARYALLGYTSAFDAAVSPLAARHTRLELGATPCIDSGYYSLVGNNVPLLSAISSKKDHHTDKLLSWILDATGSYAPKLVNPGGVENWKQYGTDIRSLDQEVAGIETTPSEIISEVTAAAGRLNLPHPVHIHCNQLGLPGNWKITQQTMNLLAGQRAHLTHIQFHSYGGDRDESTFCSKVPELAAIVNRQPNLSVDVGQILFGETTSLTGDGPASQYLSQLYGKKWINHDTELESGCGILPIQYKNRSAIHAWQWAIGLQWYLLVDNPWQVVMSTDHPNGGSFTAYPHIIRLLMDRNFRREQVQKLPHQIQEQSGLLKIHREYSLQEIAIITRSGPAKLLGLRNKGHFGIGADADITVYLPDPNFQQMFQMPKHVIKSGKWVVKDYQLTPGAHRQFPGGNILSAQLTETSEQRTDWDQWVHKTFEIPSWQYRAW